MIDTFLFITKSDSYSKLHNFFFWKHFYIFNIIIAFLFKTI